MRGARPLEVAQTTLRSKPAGPRCSPRRGAGGDEAEAGKDRAHEVRSAAEEIWVMLWRAVEITAVPFSAETVDGS